MTVPQYDSTLIAVRKIVRRLTNSASQSSLSDNDLDQFINTFYNCDFPYAIKLDQMRTVYTFYTRPYVDRYPVDVNYFQGFRAPFEVDGLFGSFFKDRIQFFNLWPKFPTLFKPASGDGTNQVFTFQLPGPFLSNQVTIGAISTSGAAIQIKDNGRGRLYYTTAANQTSVPSQAQNPAVPGMYNTNLNNPGLQTVTDIGGVDYISGNFAFNLGLVGLTPAAGSEITVFVSQYQTGRPYNLLFWNNELTIRPVPKLVHKLTIEAYQTPVQFMSTTDHPIINQWVQYIAYGVACEIQRQRNDFESVNQLMEGMQRQEGLVLERQATEEIGQPNYTIFNSTVPIPYLNNFWGSGMGSY